MHEYHQTFVTTVADLLNALVCFAMAFSLVTVLRKRSDFRIRLLMTCIVFYLIGSGIVDFLDFFVGWGFIPGVYEDAFKMVSAVIAVITAVLLIKFVPKSSELPSPQEWELHRPGTIRVKRLNAIERLFYEPRSVLEGILKNYPYPIFFKTVDGNSVFFNSSHGIGVKSEDTGDAMEFNGFHDQLLRDLPGRHQIVVETRQPHQYQDRFVVSGITKFVTTYYFPIFHNDVVIGVGGVCCDVTNEKKTERKLRVLNSRLQEANLQLERFSHFVFHDFKAPLRGVLHLVDWIRADQNNHLSKESEKYLEMISGKFLQMSNLLNGFFDLCRVDQEFQSKPERIEAGRICEEIRSLAAVPAEFSLHLTTSGFEHMETFSAPLISVLRSLIENSVQHHDQEHGNIWVEIGLRDRKTYDVKVSDDGPGIPGQFKERIFEGLVSLSPKDKTQRSGMGLTIVKKTLNLFKQKIEVRDRSPRGTIFVFGWPRKQASCTTAKTG